MVIIIVIPIAVRPGVIRLGGVGHQAVRLLVEPKLKFLFGCIDGFLVVGGDGFININGSLYPRISFQLHRNH